MKKQLYRVKVKVTKFEYYDVEAESAEEAKEEWGMEQCADYTEEDFDVVKVTLKKGDL